MSQLLGPSKFRCDESLAKLDLNSIKPFPSIVNDAASTRSSSRNRSYRRYGGVYGAPSRMGYTENGSATFLSTGNPCLDFFFHILPDTPQESLIQRLELAWKHNPLTTLKLICHLRDVRGTGKSDKNGFYVAALWLHEHHPKTLALNAKWFAEFGYLKDLLEILFRVVGGLDAREKSKKERKHGVLSWKRGKRIEKKETVYRKRGGQMVAMQRSMFKTQNLNIPSGDKEKCSPKDLKKKRFAIMASKALQMYNSDEKYRVLHEQISDLFAELLSSDLENLKNKKYKRISLASKWCPSLDSSYDRYTLICESIAKKVFPRDSDPAYAEIEEAHYAYRVRDRLRKEVLVPLHQSLGLPEIFMSAQQWNTLPYERVASVAMKIYKELFVEHDLERFQTHLENVKSGKAKIAAGALFPHEILNSLDQAYGQQELIDVAELQWKRMVEDLSMKGTLSNCLAICDVSGSMSGLPMEVCVALGMLISELSEDPWKGKLITFSKNPTLQLIRGYTLMEKKSFVRRMQWGMNTDFQKVFDLILQVAVNGKLKESDMIKRVFVFSDMEFDQASARPWETDYMAIQRKFTERGYGSCVPEIVFWNLRDSGATPVSATQNGVALVSGYSKNLVKLFLEGEGGLNPEVIMEAAIAGKEYEQLNVYD
ncbi:hypothetical protein ACHQM5_028357 [Ranunculus cassubicifolius]